MEYDTTSLANGVSRGLDRYERSFQNGKIADNIVKVNPEMLQMLGMSKEQFGGLSAEDKTSAVTGTITALGVKRQQQEAQAQEQERAQQAGALKLRSDQDAAVAEAVRTYLANPQAKPRDRFNTAVQTPGLGGAGSLKLIEALKELNLVTGDGQAQVPAGFKPTRVHVAQDGTQSTEYAPDPASGVSQVPAGFKPKTVHVGADGKTTVDYAPENEGKALTAEELKKVTALEQSESDINALEKLFKDLGPDWGGPVSGRMKSLASMGQNVNVAAIENAITAATPNLARGVFGEVGVLTDTDIKRYTSQLPSAYDTDAVRKVKLKQLREHLTEQKKKTFEGFKNAGRDVKDFKADAAPAVKADSRFDTEESARTAGAKTGDIILLRDPATGNYRKARLK